jgi:hypothetical protein
MARVQSQGALYGTKERTSAPSKREETALLNDVLKQLKDEIDRSTLQCIVVKDSTARYMISPEIVDEVLKHLLGEFLIGLLGLELLHGLGQQLHLAGQYLRDWVAGGHEPPPIAKAELDTALETALEAARAHARSEADLLAATKRVEELMRRAGASSSETADVVNSLKGVLGRWWTK